MGNLIECVVLFHSKLSLQINGTVHLYPAIRCHCRPSIYISAIGFLHLRHWQLSSPWYFQPILFNYSALIPLSLHSNNISRIFYGFPVPNNSTRQEWECCDSTLFPSNFRWALICYKKSHPTRPNLLSKSRVMDRVPAFSFVKYFLVCW